MFQATWLHHCLVGDAPTLWLTRFLENNQNMAKHNFHWADRSQRMTTKKVEEKPTYPYTLILKFLEGGEWNGIKVGVKF